MRYYWWTSLLCASVLIGCNSKTDAAPQTKQGEQSAASPATTSAPPPVVQTPKVEDVDVSGLKQSLRCPSKGHAAACEVLDGFEQAEAWNLTTIRSDVARYFGQATEIKNGVSQSRWVFMIVRRLPLNEVHPGNLAIRVALRDLEDKLTAENAHAPRLWRVLKHDNAVAKGNRMVDYLQTYTPSTWDTAGPTSGKSSILHVGEGMYVRQDAKQALYVVNLPPARPGSSEHDATLIKLYPISW